MVILKKTSSDAFKQKWLNWRGIGLWVLIPAALGGLILYFFVFKDYNDPREILNTETAYEHLFLPLLPPQPPLDSYTLLGFNHIFDYVLLLLLWSPIASFVVLLTMGKRKEINWNKASILSVGLILILFAAMMFAINPLLSMQLDWDLMCIPAPIFLVFVVLLAQQVQDWEISRNIWFAALGLGLLSTPNFLIHKDVSGVSARLESLGIRMYHTYYEWSSKALLQSLRIGQLTLEGYEESSKAVIDELRPHALPQKDFAFAELLENHGKFLMRNKKEVVLALDYLTESKKYYPLNTNIPLLLMEGHFLLKEFDKALFYSQELIELKSPTEAKPCGLAYTVRWRPRPMT